MIVTVDTETTSVDTGTAEIIELAILYDESDLVGLWRFRPTKPIPPEATKVHGITDDAVREAPRFYEHAAEVAGVLESASVIIGYNVDFDLAVLDTEFRRIIGGPRPVINGHIVCALSLWREMRPRRLTDAHEAFVGAPHENAHSAEADVRATRRVATAMLDAFGLDGKTWEEIGAIANPTRPTWLGGSRHFQWRGDVAVIAFGKNSGTEIHKLETGYFRWIASKDFPSHVKEICMLALKIKEPRLLYTTLAMRYPRPTVAP